MRINILSPVYFVATKLEAWKGRGGDDPLSSHDLEDVLTLVDGRESLCDEITAAEQNVRLAIANEFSRLFNLPSFEYAIAGNAADLTRERLIRAHWLAITNLKDTEQP